MRYGYAQKGIPTRTAASVTDLLRVAGFEDDDEDENEAPCEVARSIRKRSWKRTARPLSRA